MKKMAIFMFIALVCAGCSSPRYFPFVFKQDDAREIRSVAMAPLNLIVRMPPYAAKQAETIEYALIGRIESASIAVQPAGNIRAIWQEERQKVGGVFNPDTGALLQDRFITSLQRTVKRVCADMGVDAVIIPELILRKAVLESSYAYWDGTQQRIELGSGSETPITDKISGTAKAVSISVYVVTKDGRIVLKNIAGLEFPYKAVLDKKNKVNTTMELCDNPFTDEAAIRRAVALGLHPFIPDPEFPAHPEYLEN
jgi:hypothetical protein